MEKFLRQNPLITVFEPGTFGTRGGRSTTVPLSHYIRLVLFNVTLQDNLRVERLNLDGTDVTDDGIHHVAEMMLENITIFHLVRIISQV